eukprot:COSAG02_NODE_4146_length_5717_cov_3.929690_5_plen_137_part_00
MSASSEPGTPRQAGCDRAFQLQRQLAFEGDDVSSPSEDEDADVDVETAVDMIAPRGAQLQIHLFPTFATLQESGAWKVNVHGWYVMTHRCELDACLRLIVLTCRTSGCLTHLQRLLLRLGGGGWVTEFRATWPAAY